MFWDKVAGIYDLFGNIYNGKVNREMCRLTAEKISPEDRVLECACGTGMMTVQIAPLCAAVTATDYAEGMLKKTREKCRDLSNVQVMQADITQLPFADDCYDVVIAANVIHLLDDPYKALSELNRVTRPGGLIIIPTYVNKEKTGRDSELSKVFDKAGADFKRQFTFANYGAFLTAAGYAVEEMHRISGRVPCALAVIRKRTDK